jgi:hypothetical protein
MIHVMLLQLYYLDHLHDSAAPQNKRGTPRIKYFDRNIIQALTRADKGKIRQGQEPFVHCSVFFYAFIIFFYQFNLPYIWYMDRSSVVYIYKWNSTLYDVQCHLNFMLSTISCYACFLSSLWYNYHRCTVINFTVWPVYAVNNVVLCIVAHTFIIQLSLFYACFVSSLWYNYHRFILETSLCTVMLHRLTSLYNKQRHVMHSCTYMYATFDNVLCFISFTIWTIQRYVLNMCYVSLDFQLPFQHSFLPLNNSTIYNSYAPYISSTKIQPRMHIDYKNYTPRPRY